MTTYPKPSELIHALDETPPLRHRIHQQLEGLITSGTLRPGVRLVESELATTLGVSRGPIREALQSLQRDGFIDLRPRQGAFVHIPTAKEIEDFFDIRRALETESARLAARRVTPDGAKALRETLQRGLETLEEGDDPSAVAQIGLHQAITAVADNPVLAQMLGTIELRTNWYRSPFEPSMRRRAWDEHRVIVEAVIAGDTAAAMNAMATHIDNSRDHLFEARGDSSHE